MTKETSIYPGEVLNILLGRLVGGEFIYIVHLNSVHLLYYYYML